MPPRFDFGQLSVSRVIVHDIPHRVDQNSGPSLSEVDSDLTVELRNYFKERISQSLTYGAFNVRFNPSSHSPVAAYTSQIFEDPSEFVDASQGIAWHLFNCQTGAMSEGLLAVIEAAMAGNPCFGVLKLEREAGIQVEPTDKNGKRTFQIVHIPDLTLTEGTRVFKAALFPKPTDGDVSSIIGKVSDKQKGPSVGAEIADFFLRKFLGCELAEEANVLTKRFLDLSQDYINDSGIPSERKAQYEIALLAELSSQSNVIEPRTFADRNMIPEDRDGYLQALEKSQLGQPVINKDLTLVRNRLKRIQMEFRSGVAILANRATFQEMVVIEQMPNGRTRVQIEDILTQLHGAS